MDILAKLFNLANDPEGTINKPNGFKMVADIALEARNAIEHLRSTSGAVSSGDDFNLIRGKLDEATKPQDPNVGVAGAGEPPTESTANG